MIDMNLKEKRTKVIALAIVVVLAGTAAIATFFVRPGYHHHENIAKEETLYTCGMHPQVIQKKPGNCPICGMKLTPIRKQGGVASASTSAQNHLPSRLTR